jgi:hypothetical protein
MAKGRARADHGPAVLANISRLRSASERARCLIGPHRASHQLAADHLVRGEARLLHRPGGIADALALRQEARLPGHGRPAPQAHQRSGPSRGSAPEFGAFAHAVGERAERQKRP